jgi:hypothetical protein
MHSHSQILPLNVTGAYMLRIGPPANFFHLAANARSGRIPGFVFKRGSVNLLQLCIVHISAEGLFHGCEIGFVAVRRDLYATLNSIGSVLHEIHCPIRSASADEIRDHQPSICIDSDPRPNVTPADFLFLNANVFSLCADICPNLVTLKPTHSDVAYMLIVIRHASPTEIDQEFRDRVPGYTSHSRSGTDAIPFDKSRYDSNSVSICQRVHNEHYA